VRLSQLKIIEAKSCGGLLDGLEVDFGERLAIDGVGEQGIVPLCLIGPNGSGKSQLLQLLAEIFQTAWNHHDDSVERLSANDDTLFELTYLIRPSPNSDWERVRLSRLREGRRVKFSVSRLRDGVFEREDWTNRKVAALLPSLIVGYSSGDNETLSLPFLISRSGYAADVRDTAQGKRGLTEPVKKNNLLRIDYSNHLEVLVATQMIADADLCDVVLAHAQLEALSSFRCRIRLNGSATPNIDLTKELEKTIDALKNSATCWGYEEKTRSYTLDYYVTDATRKAFDVFFDEAFKLYRSLNALDMLNDLAIPASARERVMRDAKRRRFAAQLPEPQDEVKVFLFEELRFLKRVVGSETVVDYVSLSDGEHQQAQMLAMLGIIRDQSALFLLDEPESHLNPKWRVKFASLLAEVVPDKNDQEILITSHAPFLPSDIDREQVLIFRKDEKTDSVQVENPSMQTFGATYDRILDSCFGVEPPISGLARSEIARLMETEDVDLLRRELHKLGPSVEKTLIADRLRRMTDSAGD